MARSLDSEIELALTAPCNSDEYWALVGPIQERGDDETFRAAVKLCADTDSESRYLGAAILGQLGDRANLEDRPFRSESVELLIGMLGSETDEDVLVSVAAALGYLEDPRAIGPLRDQRHHPDADVRHAVVLGLTPHEDDLAVDALVELSADSDSDVRDWATFALGRVLERDTPQIREALAERLDDTDGDTLDEAIVGLAYRGDSRAVEPLLARLDDGREGPLLDEALFELGARLDDLRLRPHLRDRWERRGADPDFSPERRDDDERLLNAARRYGIAE